MSYYKSNLTEADLFFICDGFHCEYARDKNDEKPHNRLTFDSYDKLISRFCQELSIDVNMKPKTEDILLEKEIQDGLLQKNPVILMVDPKILTYHPLEENIENSCHCVLAYGLDSNDAYIGDPYVVNSAGEVTTYSGPFELEQLNRGTYGLAWFDISGQKEVPVIEQPVIIDRLINTFSKFLMGKKNGDFFVGNKALIKCIEDISDFQNIERSILEKNLIEFIYMVKVRFTFIIDYFISILSAHKEAIRGDYQVIIGLLNEMKNEWNAFIVRLLMASQSNESFMLERAIKKGLHVIKKQERLFFEILAVFKSLKEDLAH